MKYRYETSIRRVRLTDHGDLLQQPEGDDWELVHVLNWESNKVPDLVLFVWRKALS